ncbi:hypothetical protein [Paraburkholderia hospita]|uniref:hypothetical protein n=1 Tax=Paraburkholderia hospita TaxID=169430 RepID=UPI003ED00FFE
MSVELKAALLVIGTATAGWMYFWGWYLSAHLGRILVYGLPPICSLIVSYRRKEASDFLVPVAACLAVLITYIVIAGDQGNLISGSRMIENRYWTGIDNDLPRLVLDRLLAGNLHGILTGDWHISDRGPLIAGVALAVYPTSHDGIGQFAFFASSTSANALWVIGLWAFLNAVKITRGRTSLIIIIIAAAAGPNFANTVYTWPKLFAGALVLTVAAAIMSRDARPVLRAAIIGAGSALAFVAHGSAAFGLIGLLPVLWTTRRDWKVRHVVLSAVLFSGLCLPWISYQRFVDPPGDRLIKWHLAGIVPPDESISSGQAILRSYREAGVTGTVRNKLNNLRTVLGDWSLYRSQIIGANAQAGWSDSFSGMLRQATTARLLPSAGLMLFGLLAFVLKRTREARWVSPTIRIIAASAMAYVILEWGGDWFTAAWLHTTPASLSVLWAIVGALALSELGSVWLALAGLAQLIVFGLLWGRGIVSNSAIAGVAPMDSMDLEMKVIEISVFILTSAYLLASIVRTKNADGAAAIFCSGTGRRIPDNQN